tara:strand:- start:5817 stop:6101 length:285 start_codon:yes stop_codon:yes gene_type:complete
MIVKVMRMSTGEEIIFTFVKEDDKVIEVENPLVALPNAQGQVGFVPYSLLQKENTTLEIDKEFVIYTCDAREEVVENYEQIFSPIQTPSKKLIL